MSDMGTTAYEAIQALKNRRDWDAYDAPRIAPEACDLAAKYYHEIARALGVRYDHPVVGPTPESGVCLAWRAKRGGEVDLLCTPTSARYVQFSPDRVRVHTAPAGDPQHFAVQVLKQLEL